MSELFASMNEQLKADRAEEMARSAAAARYSDLNAGARVWVPGTGMALGGSGATVGSSY